MSKYKVLFCDLDGTLITTQSGETFPKGVWDMKFRFEVLDAIKKLNPKYVFIVSNQGGIESGFVDEDAFRSKMDYIIYAISEYTGIDWEHVDYTYCESNDKNDILRKPNTEMLQSFKNCCYNFNKKDCLMIGDASGKQGQYSDTDKKTAENFGIDYLDVDDFVNMIKEK